MSDPVSHPSHYTTHPSGVECIDIVKHHKMCIGSAIKYLWRQGLKDGNPAVQDLRKAKEYIQFEIDRLEAAGVKPSNAEPVRIPDVMCDHCEQTFPITHMHICERGTR